MLSGKLEILINNKNPVVLDPFAMIAIKNETIYELKNIYDGESIVLFTRVHSDVNSKKKEVIYY